jgi:hypothetical protein
LLEDSALRSRPETFDAFKDRGNIRDPKLDLDFPVSRAKPGFLFSGAHRLSISRRRARPRSEEGCQSCAGASIIASLPRQNALS